ncbi:hypothetical protein N7462_000701 [Penicillium macrosclerotiorum]|uniref:uncharacterized protein n=1 Tax=Penicillium macrosclerotiorum TaxID=303699 RepID=UPI002549B9AC|nr:uncharacterized protein N7462_000701 [Penicillium macrosclerotiorum]KAJ5698696.1 hypothetical protein N7462_000701 [Penicillium macrosclerotiorum]
MSGGPFPVGYIQDAAASKACARCRDSHFVCEAIPPILLGDAFDLIRIPLFIRELSSLYRDSVVMGTPEDRNAFTEAWPEEMSEQVFGPFKTLAKAFEVPVTAH